MWKDLTLKEKAEIMKMSVANGVTDINDIQELYDDSIYAEGGHLYKNAGPLDKGKQQPKYRYGTIEQALVEGGAGGLFRVTSASRKPNEAGNAGKSSAHTYTLSDGSPAALDIVPNGIGWDEFFAVMNTPKMRASLAKHGFDILNETSKAMMAKTNATGPHLHVGRGIKGQSGTGNFYGGNVYGGGYGNNYRANRGSYTDYQYSPQTIMPQAMEPITLAGSNATSPWLDYISKIGQQRPVTFNTPIGTSNSLASNGKINVGSVDFSNIGRGDELMSFVDPYTSKQALEYNLGLENNALWDSPYLLFSNHITANGGHLFDDGSMLLKDNAINPALQYVYGENYEDIIKRRRNWRPKKIQTQESRQYDIKQRADVVANTSRPVQKNIRQKQVDSPARRAEEQRKADAAYWQGIREKQGNIGPVVDGIRHPDYDPVKANQVQALREKEAKENQNAYFRRVAEHNIAEGMEAIPWPSTVAGSLFNPNTHWYDPGSFFTNLYANDNRGFFNYNQATRDFYDANPEVGSVANLIGDFVVPGAAAKILKGVGRAGKFAAADIGNAWKIMRYELAHPEVQTYGIIPDRLNPFISKKEYDTKLRKLFDIKNKTTWNDYPTEFEGFTARLMPISGDPTQPIRFIDNVQFHGKFGQEIPLQGGITLSYEPPNKLERYPFRPLNREYDPIIGGDTQNLTVQNILGKVQKQFQRKAGTYNGSASSKATIPEYTYFTEPGIPNAEVKNGKIDTQGEKIRFFGATDYQYVYPETRAGLGEVLPVDHPIRVAATNYVNDLETRLATSNGLPLATVEGSYRAVMNGLPHTPKDVEFLLPESNLEKMKRLFNVRSMKPKGNGFGYTVEADEFDHLFGNRLGKVADFEVIKNGPNGGAIGNTAWEIYQYLHPEEASKLNKIYRHKVASNMRTSVAPSYKEGMELPISAEQLYKEYIESGLYKKKYLYDTMGAMPENDPLKHMIRRNDLELGWEDSQEMLQHLTDRIHKEFPGAKTLREQGYKIDYTDVEANKKFLNHYGLPEEYATDPTRMEIIVEQQIHGYQTVKRGTNEAIPGQSGEDWVKKPIEEREKDIQNMNTEAGGNSMSGPGENATNQIDRLDDRPGLIREVEIARQIPLTVRPEVIKGMKTPEDLINRIEEIRDLSIKYENELQQLNNLATKQETHQFAMDHDLPAYSRGANYGGRGNYHANLLMGKDIAFDMRYVGDTKGFEIVKPFVFKSVSNKTRPWEVTQEYMDKIYQGLLNSGDNSVSRFSDAKAYNKLNKIQRDLERRRTFTIGSEIAGGTLAAGIPLTYGLQEGIKYIDNSINPPSARIKKQGLDTTKEAIEEINNNSIRMIAYYSDRDLDVVKNATAQQFAEYKQEALQAAQEDSIYFQQEFERLRDKEREEFKKKHKKSRNKLKR